MLRWSKRMSVWWRMTVDITSLCCLMGWGDDQRKEEFNANGHLRATMLRIRWTITSLLNCDEKKRYLSVDIRRCLLTKLFQDFHSIGISAVISLLTISLDFYFACDQHCRSSQSRPDLLLSIECCCSSSSTDQTCDKKFHVILFAVLCPHRSGRFLLFPFQHRTASTVETFLEYVQRNLS